MERRTRVTPNGDGSRRGVTALRVALVSSVLILVALGLILRSRSDGDGRGPRPTTPSKAPLVPDEPVLELPVREAVPSTNTDAVVAPRHAPIDGWRIEGRVHARGRPAVPGARVRIELVSTTVTRVVADTTTDADGRFAQATPALDVLDPDRAPPVEVRVSVDARGYRPVTVRTPIDLTAVSRSATADVRLEPGERLSGRVVDGAGRPVAQASVSLSVDTSGAAGSRATRDAQGVDGAGDPNAAGTPASWRFVEETTTGGDGRFELGFASSARYRVQARADGVGTGIVDGLELEAGTSRGVGDVKLSGGKAITGVLLDPNGDPVPQFELGAVDDAWALQGDPLTAARARALDVERADGLATMRTRTDEKGRFTLKGLRPGRYAVVPVDPQARFEPREARHEPGAKDVRVTLLARRLLVRVVDDEGYPVRGATVRLTDLERRDDGSYASRTVRFASTRWPGSVATFLLATGEDTAPTAYSVYAEIGARHGTEDVVTMGENAASREVTLVIPRRGGTGRLALAVLGADGRPLHDLRVMLLSSVTGARMEEIGLLTADENDEIASVPVGTYRLLVGYAPGSERDHFPVRSEQPVTVTADETTSLSLRAVQGGRLTVTMSARGPLPREVEEALAGTKDPVRGHELDALTRPKLGLAIELAPSAGGAPPRAVQFRSGDERGLLGQVLPGETLVSEELFEPGVYTLTGSGGVFQLTDSTTARIAPGAANAVTIRVEPR